jgi:hypothetical protein
MDAAVDVMSRATKPDVTYDPVVKRWRATCPCGYVAVRAKREAALWALEQHVAYSHDGRPS